MGETVEVTGESPPVDATVPDAIGPMVQSTLNNIVPAGTPGVSVYVSREGRSITLHAGRYAAGSDRMLDDKARFPIGGLVNPLRALLCLGAISEGRLSLDVPVGTVLPELAAKSLPEITVRHLLSHTEGFCDPTFREIEDFEWEDWAYHFSHRRQAFPPGLVWSLGQSGHQIIRRLLEAVYDIDCDALVQEKVLIPVGIVVDDRRDDHVRYHSAPGNIRPDLLPPSEVVAPLRGGMSSSRLTISQIGRLGELFAGRTDHPLSDLAVLMRQNLLPTHAGRIGPGWEVLPDRYGLGLGARFGAFGCVSTDAGSTCSFRFDQDGAVVAVAMNACNDGARDHVTFRAMTAMGLKAPQDPEASIASVPVDGLAGFYSGQAMGYEAAWIESDGRCTVDFAKGAKKFEINRDSHDRLYLKAESGPSMPLAVFTDPATQGTALMIGSSAFKKNVTAQ